MKNLIHVVSILLMFSGFIAAQDDETVRVYGKVTYFNGEPVVNAIAQLRGEGFATIYGTKTNSRGEYELKVEKGRYLAFVTVKDYATKNLEYWAWNVPAYKDLEINAKIDSLEIYGINAFTVPGPSNFYVYFRPMSLKKVQASGMSREEQEKQPLIDIAPNLTVEDVEIRINGEAVKILDVTKVKEFSSDGRAIYAYFVQPVLPDGWQTSEYLHILITLTDSETGEKGESSLYWEVPKYMTW